MNTEELAAWTTFAAAAITARLMPTSCDPWPAIPKTRRFIIADAPLLLAEWRKRRAGVEDQKP